MDEMDRSKIVEMVTKMRDDLQKDAADNPWLQQFF
jgi:DNA mismatch repair protein MSH2